MAKGKLVLNSEGVRQMLLSDDLMQACKQQAEQVRAIAGEGYEVSTFVGTNRVNASVRPVTQEAYNDNLENNTLMKAVGK